MGENACVVVLRPCVIFTSVWFLFMDPAHVNSIHRLDVSSFRLVFTVGSCSRLTHRVRLSKKENVLISRRKQPTWENKGKHFFESPNSNSKAPRTGSVAQLSICVCHLTFVTACEERGKGRSRTKGERSPRRTCWALEDGLFQGATTATTEETSDNARYQPGEQRKPKPI